MVCEAGADVNVRTNNGETALLRASELVEILLQHGAHVDSAFLTVAQSEDVRSVLSLYYSSQEYHEKTTAMLTKASAGSSTSTDQLFDLVPFITSVYDLRHLLTLNSMVDGSKEELVDQRTRKLLNAAFGHILSQILVLADDACVYFLLVLEHCADSQLLTPSQFMKWKVQATKVNVESAEWVVELKKQVYENRHRLQIHQEVIENVVQGLHSVMQHLEQEDRSRHIKAVCGLLASVVGFVFAPLLKTVFDSLIDLANPIEIFNHLYQKTDVVEFLADTTYVELIKLEVQRQLEKYVIPTAEFETLLRRGIILKKPEFVKACYRRGLKYESKSVEDSTESTITSIEDYYSSTNSKECPTTAAPSEFSDGNAGSTLQAPEETCHQINRSRSAYTLSHGEIVTFVEDLEAIPYHLAVMESHGNLREFQDLSDVIDDDVDCVNAVTEVRLMKQQTQNVTINAADYAQLLGYSQLASLISSQMGISTPPQTQNQVFVTFSDDIQTCPFFVAVQESEGDVDEFKQWLEVLECEDDQIDTKVCATINWEDDTDLKKWSPVELACHFGYVDIVKHLLLKKRAKTGGEEHYSDDSRERPGRDTRGVMYTPSSPICLATGSTFAVCILHFYYFTETAKSGRPMTASYSHHELMTAMTTEL